MESTKYVDFHNRMETGDEKFLGHITTEEYYDLVDMFNKKIGLKKSASIKQLSKISDIISFLSTASYLYEVSGRDDETDKILSSLGVNISLSGKKLIEDIQDKIKKLTSKYVLIDSNVVRPKNNKSAQELIALLSAAIESYLPSSISISEYIAYYKVARAKKR